MEFEIASKSAADIPNKPSKEDESMSRETRAHSKESSEQETGPVSSRSDAESSPEASEEQEAEEIPFNLGREYEQLQQ